MACSRLTPMAKGEKETMTDRQGTHTLVSVSELVSPLGRQTSDHVQFVDGRARLHKGADVQSTVDVQCWSPTRRRLNLLPNALER